MKRTFTRLFICTFLTSAAMIASAQERDSVKASNGGKNLVRVSLTSLALKTYSLTYERKIAKKIAIGIGLRSMPESSFPFLDQFESVIDDPETYGQLKDLKTSNVAVTPEIKFYFGKDVFRGFYIAPFARYAKFNASVPFDFEFTVGTTTQERTIPLDGDITAITGGILFGAQWKLSKRIYLDWSILGPHYGKSKGSVVGTMTLNNDEQAALREELEDLEIPLTETEVTVNSSGAKVDVDGPWGGARASIGLAFRF